EVALYNQGVGKESQPPRPLQCDLRPGSAPCAYLAETPGYLLRPDTLQLRSLAVRCSTIRATPHLAAIQVQQRVSQRKRLHRGSVARAAALQPLRLRYSTYSEACRLVYFAYDFPEPGRRQAIPLDVRVLIRTDCLNDLLAANDS